MRLENTEAGKVRFGQTYLRVVAVDDHQQAEVLRSQSDMMASLFLSLEAAQFTLMVG